MGLWQSENSTDNTLIDADQVISGDWNFENSTGFGTDVFTFKFNPEDTVERTAKVKVKSNTSGNVDLTQYSIVTVDSNDKPIMALNNTGRMDLVDHSGQGAITCLYNNAPAVNEAVSGHYAYGSKNADGYLNTVAYLLASVADTASNSMNSSLKFGIMVDKDTTAGYSQPNVFMTFSSLGLSVPIGADFLGTVSLRGSLTILNKAETAWLPFATRYTGGTEAGVILENIVSVKASNAVAIGITTPESYLHIKAGTTTLAPIKLTAGVALTTPQTGVIEYVDDGTTGHLYFTCKVAGVTTRKEIAFV